MGMPTASVQAGTQPQGKGFSQPINPPPQSPEAQEGNQFMISSQPMASRPGGKNGQMTNSATSGQPRVGQPNMYPNTIGQWDNASIQPQQRQISGGKGKV